MIKSIGLDLVDIARINNNITRYGLRFIRRLLSNDEWAAYQKRYNKALFLAGRFAAKEAVIKGLGLYLSNRPALKDIQILNNPSGQPELMLPRSVQNKMPKTKCILSITHENRYAAAVAVFVEEK